MKRGLVRKLSKGSKDLCRSKKGRKKVRIGYFHKVFKLLILFSFVLLIWAIIKIPYFVTTTSYLALKEFTISIKGEYLTKQRVDTLFKRFVLKRYSCSHPNILKLDIADTERYLLSAVEIKTVKIKRYLFQKRITIEAEGRIPEVKLQKKDGKWIGIDEEGIPFPIDAKIKLPIIYGFRKIIIGKQITTQGLQDLFLIKQKDKELGFGLWARVKQINISNNLCLIIEDGTRIYFGQRLEENRLISRLKELNAILKYLKETEQVNKYIDLRFDNILIKDI